jgi:lambda repressor-like predicted transcriptional regulator
MKYRRLTGKDLGAYIKSCKKDIIKRDLSHKIGMTENGLNSALSRESLRLSVFQDICEALGTHPSSFFLLPGQDLPEALSLEEPGTEYKFVDQEQIPRVLYNEMKQHLEGEISYLRQQNDALIKMKS